VNFYSEAKHLIKTLEDLSPLLILNKGKCGIIDMFTDRQHEVSDSLRGIPFVSTYKYLGVHLFTKTKEIKTNLVAAFKSQAF
jgi:hypothetical protein